MRLIASLFVVAALFVDVVSSVEASFGIGRGYNNPMGQPNQGQMMGQQQG
jgi:hypothetical protein